MFQKLTLIGAKVDVSFAYLLAELVESIVSQMFASTNEAHKGAHVVLGKYFAKMQ